MAKAIVAFEVEVLSIDNVFKLSQNRDEKSYHSIINKLQSSDEDSQNSGRDGKKNFTII